MRAQAKEANANAGENQRAVLYQIFNFQNFLTITDPGYQPLSALSTRGVRATNLFGGDTQVQMQKRCSRSLPLRATAFLFQNIVGTIL